MKINLCILAGNDNRYPYIHDTLATCLAYFDKAVIVDTGSTDQTSTISGTKIDYVRMDGWKDDWKQAYEVAMSHVPMGEWFLFFDSDERPSQTLLNRMKSDAAEMDLLGVGLGRLPGVLHWDGIPTIQAGGGIAALLDIWPNDHEQYLSKPCWTKQLFVKHLPDTYVQAFGGHCGFYQPGQAFRYYPHFYNHYKSPSQLAASIVRCAWSCIESHGIPASDPIHALHNRLREETQILTANDLDLAIRENRVPKVFTDLWQQWKPPHVPTLEQFYYHAFRDNFKIDLALQKCGHACCSYSAGQF